MSKNVGEDQKVPSILQRKIDIANFYEWATRMQIVDLIFTISLLSSILTKVKTQLW